MNKWEKQVQQSLLKDEQQVLRILKMAYESVLAEIDAKIGDYAVRVLADEEDTAAIYQLQYQQTLREQVEKIIGDLHWKSYNTIQSYLEGTYENGFIGAMYSIHKQGIPLLLPLNQQNIVRAVTTNSKISVGLYTRLGKDIDVLKVLIAAETTRGIASGSTWHEVAAQIKAKGQIPYYNAMRIARTEGHRVQCEGQMDACQDAKAHGADVVKQWDAALDRRTRPLHRQLDGQIRELEEPFEIAGYHAMQPGAFDAPEMDIHCRCAMLQRARWALDEEELETLKERAEYYGLDKTEQFEDFKRKYLDAVEDAARNQPKTLDNSGGSGIIEAGSDAMALENQRYGRNKNTLVNKAYIDSGEYRRKYDNATEYPEVNKTLYDCAKTALKHRSGTAFEDMYWIDGTTGRIVAKEIDGTLERAVKYSASTKKAVNAYEKKQLISLHTHPSSMPPSAADFNACFRHGYRQGYIACHDGKIFAYTADEEVNERLYNMYIESYIKAGQSEYDAQWSALSEMKRNCKIDFWEVN